MDVEKSRLKEGSKDEYEKYTETETINSMIPIWKKNKNEITEDEYNSFYTDKFYDYDKPIKTIHREMLQQNTKLKLIAKSIEKKIKKELENMLKNNRETYDNFFKTFGMQLKFGIYSEYGLHKDELKDLIMFYSSTEKKLVTLEEYTSRMKEGQENIYYACGESNDKVDNMPQVELIKDKGYEILYLTEYVDEFALQTLTTYNAKKFVNVSNDNVDLDTEEEKKELEKINENSKELYKNNKEELENYTKILYSEARLIEGLPIDNPTEISNLICDIISK